MHKSTDGTLTESDQLIGVVDQIGKGHASLENVDLLFSRSCHGGLTDSLILVATFILVSLSLPPPLTSVERTLRGFAVSQMLKFRELHNNSELHYDLFLLNTQCLFHFF